MNSSKIFVSRMRLFWTVRVAVPEISSGKSANAFFYYDFGQNCVGFEGRGGNITPFVDNFPLGSWIGSV